ncbi:MAG: TonB-dependent receptor [Bryobacteraceae bacterium]
MRLLILVAVVSAAQTPEIPVLRQSVVITASPVAPQIDRRNGEVFVRTLYSRDDQVFHLLDAGINAGQHQGGGKSIEVRRFGFNLDHGGVNGGLKVLIDGVQQNQTTQGHGQGYLGSLKSLTPELVQEVNLINGPFSAEYGDFSGLGVVHIRMRESLPDLLTARIQGGSFNTRRGFLGFSPHVKRGDALLAYEGSATDGPFLSPLRYRRDNVTASFTRRLSESRTLGFKANGGRNNFFASGQLPLDEVAAGRLDRFGAIDPSEGGRVRSATAGAYFRQEGERGEVWKLDGFVARSLFDLYSNFTFFLNDRENGDGIQQHDSRLQQGANAQYQRPQRLGSAQGLLTAGANYHDNQIHIGLYPQAGRVPLGVATRANVRAINGAGYVQESVSLFDQRLQIGGGLRYDAFRFQVQDRVAPELSGVESPGRWQPKAHVAFTPSRRIPATLYVNYGRGIATSDARAVVHPESGPRLATTDFYQAGTSHHFGRLAVTTDAFFIDRSNERVYIPDDGTYEFLGPSRAYGFEGKASVQLTRAVALNAGLTRVLNAFYRGPGPRVYVDSAPHFVANAGLTLSYWKGWSGSLRMRAINGYRLDGEDPSIRAAGHTVFDLHASRQLRRGVELSVAVDNLTDRSYYETQNYFESRLAGRGPLSRIHGTPGYPVTVTVGLTFRLFGK